MNTENKRTSQGIYTARWERAFDKILTPLEEFTQRQSSASLLLILATTAALVLANSSFAGWYDAFVHTPLGVNFGQFALEKSLKHWVNDGLMAIFFFVIGLELKREFLVGELSSPENARLPIVAAIGGMVVPALVYSWFNYQGMGAKGWGIPMATDIAFAIGILILLGDKIPKALLTFLIALAIVDDLGAVMVIAIFYTETISIEAMSIASAIFLFMLMLKHGGIRQPWPYMIAAGFLWLALLKSGVHATLAGILGALTVPVRPKYNTEKFSAHVKSLIARFEETTRKNTNVLTNAEARGMLQTLENGVISVQAPLQRLEHTWHFPVAYLILPLFAFVNAGIAIQPSALGGAFSDPVTGGIIFGLVLGKLIGVAGFSFVAVQAGFAPYPTGTRLLHIVGVAFLSGIGFTMSIFISELAFAAHPDLLMSAKLGILMASAMAAAIGVLILKGLAAKSA